MSIPKVFISYSHDTLEHKKWVVAFATRLRNNGIDAILDQWELGPGDDLPHFMETHLENSDYILMICSINYVEKANAGEGGVGYEKMIITSNLLNKIDENKIIPIIRQIKTKTVPTFLKTKLYIDFSNDAEIENSFDDLVRTIHKSPILKKPPIGNKPFKKDEPEDNKTTDNMKNILKVIVSHYERADYNYIEYETLRRLVPISRIYFDILLVEAQNQQLIVNDQGYIYLTDEGRRFALNNSLI